MSDQGSAEGALIGVVGRDVPIEMFDAVGARVRRLDVPRQAGTAMVAEPETAAATEILGTGIDPAATAALARILAGDAGGLSAIVLSSESDATQRLFYALRELAQLEPKRGLPQIHLVDVMHLPRASSLAYTSAEVARLGESAARWTGRTPSAEVFAKAVRARGDVRRLLWLLAELRPAASGADVFALRARVDELAPSAAVPELRAAIDAARATSAREHPLVVLTGSSQWGSAVIEQIEQIGVRVAADDCAGGALGLELDVREPSVDGVAERYWRDGQTAHRGSAPERAAALAARAERVGARAIISYARRRDDAAMWEVGALQAVTSLPVIVLHEQEYNTVDVAALRAGLDQIGVTR